MADLDLWFIKKVLAENKDKQFIDRVINKEKYPTLDLGNGNYATHKMAWSSTTNPDGTQKHLVYPTVDLDETGTQLKDYGKQAFDHARQTGNYIEFDNPIEADIFSRKYKKFWEDKQIDAPDAPDAR